MAINEFSETTFLELSHHLAVFLDIVTLLTVETRVNFNVADLSHTYCRCACGILPVINECLQKLSCVQYGYTFQSYIVSNKKDVGRL